MPVCPIHDLDHHRHGYPPVDGGDRLACLRTPTHPAIDAALERALGSVPFAGLSGNAWHGHDLTAENGHMARLAADSDDPGEEITVYALDPNGIVRWSARFNPTVPEALLDVAVAEALR